MRRWMILLVTMAACTWVLAGEPRWPDTAVKPIIGARTSKLPDRYGPSVPTTQPDYSKMPRTLPPWKSADPKAVELVKGVYANEDWIHQVKSFRIQVLRTMRTTPEGTAFNNNLFRERNRPTTAVCQVELAFDGKRCRYSQKPVSDKQGLSYLKIWDGTVTREYENNPINRWEGYALRSKPDSVGFMFNASVNWPRARRHFFWFDPRDTREDYYTIDNRHFQHPATRLVWVNSMDEWRRAARPEDFHIVGIQEYRGISCYVLEQRPGDGVWRWYVGVDTGLRHGTMIGDALSGTGRDDPRELEIYASLGCPLRTMRDLWLKQKDLTRQELGQFNERYRSELHRRGFESEVVLRNTTGLPHHEEWFMDYKEVARGRCWPMRVMSARYGLNGQGRLVVYETYDVRIQQIEVDAALPDELFTMEFKEGMEVVDCRYEPALRYPYRRGMPDEATLAPWRQRKEQEEAMIRRRKAALDGLIGKPAPELPARDWFNTRPPTWKDLRGQTVIVEFSHLCEQGGGQSLYSKEHDLVSALYDHRAKTGLSIISICPSRVWDSTLKDMIRRGYCQYPVCRDVPGSNEENDGGTFERYQIACGPYAFVVGPDGKVVHHGLLAELPEVRAYCEKLPPLPPGSRWTDGTLDESGERIFNPEDRP